VLVVVERMTVRCVTSAPFERDENIEARNKAATKIFVL